MGTRHNPALRAETADLRLSGVRRNPEDRCINRRSTTIRGRSGVGGWLRSLHAGGVTVGGGGASTDWRGRGASTDQSLEGYVTRVRRSDRDPDAAARSTVGARARRGGSRTGSLRMATVSRGAERHAVGSDNRSTSPVARRPPAPTAIRASSVTTLPRQCGAFYIPLPPPHGRDRPSSRAPASPTRETGSGHRARRCPWRTGAASARRGETEPATTLDTPGRIRRY